MPATLPTQASIARLVKSWARELQLADWEIVVRISPGRVMRGRHGFVHIQELKRIALICLVDPRDFNYAEVLPYDLELTLVHELVHVSFPSFIGKRPNDHTDITSEQGVHAISSSLVRMRRRGKPNRWIYTEKP